MAIYTNLKAANAGKHGLFESSLIRENGRLYDAVFTEDVDNGVLVKIGEPTGKGLQEVKGTVAAVGDKVAVTGSVPVVKESFTKGQAAAYNFYNKAGADVKCYGLEEGDVFAVADYQIVDGDAEQGKYIVVNGKGGYKAVAEAPAAEFGFVGKVHSVAAGDYTTMVRIAVVRNVQVTAQ